MSQEELLLAERPDQKKGAGPSNGELKSEQN
jgi:hypothetical protein